MGKRPVSFYRLGYWDGTPMMHRLTSALAFALFASGLLLVAPGKPPWFFYLATAASLGSLSMALFLVGRALRKLEQN